ncbi:uncharacterized protein L203_105459 [Cryptococcus depauperatus CBS 7841]|uniref:HMG box domain-containing protein n=1 Tax=Cryptococcus depauperatus CBS 7841 TaxID=1295531 RepID=A0AAJ8M3G4_9TREE
MAVRLFPYIFARQHIAMSAPSWEEMEAKRQEMIASLGAIAQAMAHCVKVINEYTALSPVQLAKPDLLPGPLTSETPLPSFMASLPEAMASTLAAVKKERKKKEKKAKDPNAPKRPPSAYILFQNEVREEIRRSNPGMVYKDILGIISQKWKDLPDPQKKIYEEAYAEAHNTFRIEEEAYSKKDAADHVPHHAEAIDEEEEDEEEESSSSGEESPAVPTIAPTLAAVSEKGKNEKKEKKRKNKDEEGIVGAIHGESKEKKKKKNKEERV